jgi:hypothetical protein
MKEEKSYPFDFDDTKGDQYDLGYRLGHRDGWGSATLMCEEDQRTCRESLCHIVRLVEGREDLTEVRLLAERSLTLCP